MQICVDSGYHYSEGRRYNSKDNGGCIAVCACEPQYGSSREREQSRRNPDLACESVCDVPAVLVFERPRQLYAEVLVLAYSRQIIARDDENEAYHQRNEQHEAALYLVAELRAAVHYYEYEPAHRYEHYLDEEEYDCQRLDVLLNVFGL